MKREQEWQEQGGGQQGTEGGPSGVDVEGPNESAPGSGDEDKEFPTEGADEAGGGGEAA